MNIIIYMDKKCFGPADTTHYLFNELKKHYDTEVSFEPDVSKCRKKDVVFTRFDIPVKTDFLKGLSIYDKLFVNNPLTKIEWESKKYLEDFMDLMPKTIFTSSLEEALKFSNGTECIYKPLNLNGGKGIKKLDEVKEINEEVMIQHFIPDVEELGDKRITIFGYQPVSVALRLPEEGSFICNTKAGGHYEPCGLTKFDEKIIEAIIPKLREKGIYWAGIDIIGDYLMEINTCSPGGLYFVDEINGNTKARDKCIEILANDNRFS